VTGETFVPGVIFVDAGTTVTWSNLDGEDHTVTSATGVFSGNLPANPGTYSYTFSKPGTYNYYCAIHTYMTGSVVVK
jgi:plastocyanin